MKKLLVVTVLAIVALAPCAFAQLAPSQNSTVTVNVASEALISLPTNVTLTSASPFADYTGTTSFTYYIRTSKASGSGSITLKVSTDFAPAGGPSVVTPPTAGDALTYTPTVSMPGTAATGPLTASTTTATSVGSFGTAASSAKAGNSASVAWDLTNDPLYSTGVYAATILWTISAS